MTRLREMFDKTFHSPVILSCEMFRQTFHTPVILSCEMFRQTFHGGLGGDLR